MWTLIYTMRVRLHASIEVDDKPHFHKSFYIPLETSDTHFLATEGWKTISKMISSEIENMG